MRSRSSGRKPTCRMICSRLPVEIAGYVRERESRVVRIKKPRVDVDRIDLKVLGYRARSHGKRRRRCGRRSAGRNRRDRPRPAMRGPDRHGAMGRSLVQQAVQVGVLETGKHQVADQGLRAGTAGMVDVTASLSAEVPVSVIGQDQLDATFGRLLLVPDGVLRNLLL